MSFSNDFHAGEDPIIPSAILSPKEAARLNAVRNTLIDEAYHVGTGHPQDADGNVCQEVAKAKAMTANGAMLGTLTAEELARQLAADEGTSGAALAHGIVSGKVTEPHIGRSMRDLASGQLAMYNTQMTIGAIGVCGVDDAAKSAEMAAAVCERQRELREEAKQYAEEKKAREELALKNQEARMARMGLLERLFC